MPPKLLERFGAIMGNFWDRSLETAQRQTGELTGELFGMTPQEFADNWTVGSEPIPFVQTFSRGIEPENPSIGIQGIASIMGPGIPGGPIFKGVKELLAGLRKMPTQEVLKVADDAAEALTRVVERPGALRHVPDGFAESRSMTEIRALSDATELDLIGRAGSGDRVAKEFIGMTDPTELGQLGQGVRRSLAEDDALLRLLDQIGSGGSQAGVAASGIPPQVGQLLAAETVGLNVSAIQNLREVMRQRQAASGAQQ